MKKTYFVQKFVFLAVTLCLLSACGPTVHQGQPQQTPTVNQQFQKQMTPMPTMPAYRCGAWASHNMPDAHSPIIIYARLTRGNASSLAGVTAHAVVHLKGGDVPLYEKPTSDTGGYVAFNLSLVGEQPRLVPATVDVTFDTQEGITTCNAFFTSK